MTEDSELTFPGHSLGSNAQGLASQETPSSSSRPGLTLTSSHLPLPAQVLPSLDTQLVYTVFLMTPAPG